MPNELPGWYSSTTSRVWVQVGKTWVCPFDVEAVVNRDGEPVICLASGQQIALPNLTIDEIMSALTKASKTDD